MKLWQSKYTKWGKKPGQLILKEIARNTYSNKGNFIVW